MAKDVASRNPESLARNEDSKETGNRDYHMCGSAGNPTSNCGQAQSSWRLSPTRFSNWSRFNAFPVNLH